MLPTGFPGRVSRFLIAFAASAVLATPPVAGQAPAVAARIPEQTRIAAEQLRQRALGRGDATFAIVRSLVVEVGPRLAGSDGDRRAVAWGERTLTGLGFANVRAEPVTVPRWLRGTATGRITAPYPQPVVLAALGGSVATPAGGLEAEVVEVASLETLDELPDERLRGKIVFFSQRMERTRDGSGYGRTVPIRSRGPARAAIKGAVAVLIRSVGTSPDRIAHTGGTLYEEGVPAIPAVALSNPDADLLAAQIATGEPVTFRLELTSRLDGEAESANVIGEVIGRERPEEVVLLACHLDSWDLGHGAVDDGSGCAIVIEAARLIGDLPRPPRRTVRVVLYANEEFGLSGARAYAERYAEDLERHVGGIEADFGAGRVWRMSSWVDQAGVETAAEIARLLAPLGVEWAGQMPRVGADLSVLMPARVPLFGLWQDGTLYFDVHHTVNDTLDRVDPESLAQNVAAHAVVAYLAAEIADPFGRSPEPPPRRR